MTRSRHPLQPFASALALLALVLRLLLPLLHDPRAHAVPGDGGATASGGCACVASGTTAPWWQASIAADDRERASAGAVEREHQRDGRERERDGDQVLAAEAPGHCLACAEAHLPPAPPAPWSLLPPLAAAPTPTIAAPRAPPRPAPERSQHHSRAPPTARA